MLIGMNIEWDHDGEGVLTLKIKLARNCGVTSTGKSVMIAKTGGWQPLYVGDAAYKLNLNLVRPLKGKVEAVGVEHIE